MKRPLTLPRPRLHPRQLHALLSVITFVGPGREIITDGFSKLINVNALTAPPGSPAPPLSSPNMNTLVALGAVSSFAMSTVAIMVPQLGWPLFFEEPTMLFAFVLFGRAMETRAKLLASSDLTSLIDLMPRTAKRLSRSFDAIRGDNRSSVGSGFSIGSFGNFVGIGNDYTVIPCSKLTQGDTIMVTPGDVLPVDGVVVNGKTSVNESSINGEAMPVNKSIGDEVFAGTVNIDGAVVVGVRSAGKDTQLAEVIRMTEEASQRTPDVQRIADIVSGRFVHGVMAASALTLGLWRTVGAGFLERAAAGLGASPTAMALQLAASVLVVACPCALGLATPTAVLVGSSVAARRGLLIRGGDVLETLSQVDTVIFDKTGTLTVGEPCVERIHMRGGGGGDGAAGEEMLKMAAAVETGSSHPLARAIVSAALGESDPRGGGGGGGGGGLGELGYDEEEGIDVDKMRDSVVLGGAGGAGAASGLSVLSGAYGAGFGIGGGILSPRPRRLVSLPAMQSGSFHQEPGLGARGVVNGRTVVVGSADWLAANGVRNLDPSTLPQPAPSAAHDGAADARADRISSSSIVHVGVAGSAGYLGSIVVADRVRPDAGSLIAKLRRRGIESFIFSGDDAVNVANVARQLGIPAANAIGDMKPRDKAEMVERMKGRRGDATAARYGDMVDQRRRPGGRGRVVAMVGDGINDITALALADVSVAVGTAADAAADVSGVVLRGGGGQLMQVDDAIDISRSTMRKVRSFSVARAPVGGRGVRLAEIADDLPPVSAADQGEHLLLLRVQPLLDPAGLGPAPPGARHLLHADSEHRRADDGHVLGIRRRQLPPPAGEVPEGRESIVDVL